MLEGDREKTTQKESMSNQARDMSQAQFDQECKKLGFEPEGFWGYYKVVGGWRVSILNAGTRRRAQLAYLIQQRDEILRQQAKKEIEK